MTDITAVILAAGKGTRMKSELPKVLHPLVGVPMVKHVMNAANKAGIKSAVIVVGHGGRQVEETLGNECQYAYQKEQLGTGHAMMAAKSAIDVNSRDILVLCGDTPLLTSDTLRDLMEQHQQTGAAVTVLTAFLDDATGYGRIVRDAAGNIQRIVEEKDASDAQKKIKEINTGTYFFNAQKLFWALEKIQPANAQGEYYLTDVLELLGQEGETLGAVITRNAEETMGVNNRVQLSYAEKLLRQRINEQWMLEGVTMVNPEQTYIDAEATLQSDCVLYPGTMLQGKTSIGRGCTLGPETVIRDSRLGDNIEAIKSVITESKVEADCKIGPFSYIRPQTLIKKGAKIGDFVELKKTTVGEGSKIPHLSYLGDCTVGTGVNVGAGTITCNYDGENKWATIIEDGAFVGSNANLVAPVRIGRGSVIGAGSTITKDVPAENLGIERAKQLNIENWSKKAAKK